MTWSYSGDPGSSAKDLTRFLIGDTEKCDQLLQDGEINWVLSQYNNTPMNAAIRCCEAIVAKLSRLADESVGQVRVSYSQRVDGYRKLRAQLVNRLATEDARPYAGGISRTDNEIIKSNPDRVPPDFTKHMQENRQIAPWVQSGILGDQPGSPDDDD